MSLLCGFGHLIETCELPVSAEASQGFQKQQSCVKLLYIQELYEVCYTIINQKDRPLGLGENLRGAGCHGKQHRVLKGSIMQTHLLQTD
jgi:hypothetical protein